MPRRTGFWIGLKPLQSSPPWALTCSWTGPAARLCATAGAAPTMNAASIKALNSATLRMIASDVGKTSRRWPPGTVPDCLAWTSSRGKSSPPLPQTRPADHPCPDTPGSGGRLGFGVRAVAVLEVPDLIREGNVVGMRRPDHPGLRRRRAVHRVEVAGDRLAACTGRVVLDLGVPVGGARCHRPGLSGGPVAEGDLHTLRRVMGGHPDPVAGVHEQGLRRVGRERRQRRNRTAMSPSPACNGPRTRLVQPNDTCRSLISALIADGPPHKPALTGRADQARCKRLQQSHPVIRLTASGQFALPPMAPCWPSATPSPATTMAASTSGT